MGIVFIGLITLYMLLLAKNLRKTTITFILLIPFMPRYIGIGNENITLSLNRILILIVFITFVLYYVQNDKLIRQRLNYYWSSYKLLFIAMFFFMLIKIFSLSINSPSIAAYFQLLNDFLFTLFAFILFLSIISSDEKYALVIKYMAIGYFLVVVIGYFDLMIHKSSWTFFSTGNIVGVERNLEGFTRGEHHRVMSTFINPIVFGQYLVILFPIVNVYLIKRYRTVMYSFILLLLVTGLLYFSYSRSAIAMFGIMGYILLSLKLSKMNRSFELPMKVLNFILLGFIIYLVYVFISEYIVGFGGSYTAYDADEISFVSRAMQYTFAFEKIGLSPYIGFGKVQNFVTFFEGEFPIDSFFFWTLFEVGFLGLFVYIYYLIYILLHVYKYVGKKNDYINAYFMSLLSIFIYQNIVVATTNNIYFYLVSALALYEIKREVRLER